MTESFRIAGASTIPEFPDNSGQSGRRRAWRSMIVSQPKRRKIKNEVHNPPAPAGQRLHVSLDAHPWLGPAALAALTLLLWSRTLGLPLHYWDDSTYFFNDPRLNVLTPSNLLAILTKPFFANYHPITTLTFLWDRLVWKTWVPGFHVTHLAFYAGSALLAYFFFLSLVRNRFWALSGAVLFSFNAVHVEPVAWLAARKDVVCLFFSAAALLLYGRYARARDCTPCDHGGCLSSYLLMMAAFLFALGSKGYAAALPFLFVAFDACYSERFEWRRLLDKIPPFTLALGLIIVTVMAQDETSALIRNPAEAYQISVFDRLTLLLKIFCLYVGRALLPVHLSATYIVSNEGWMPEWVALLGLFLLSSLVYGFFRLRKALPSVAFGFALFVLPLLTTLNTFFTLRTWMADRYVLFSTLGSSLALAALGARQIRARPFKIVAAGLAILVTVYAGLALDRLRVWSSASLLHSDAIRKNFPALAGSGIVTAEEVAAAAQGSPLPPTLQDLLAKLSLALQREGDTEQYGRIADLLGGAGYSGLEVGLSELKRGDLDKAADSFMAEVARGEWYAARSAKLLGDIYYRKGKPDEARRWYQQSASLYIKQRQSPRDARLGEGDLEFNLRNLPRALEIFQLMTRENPGDPLGPFCAARTLEAMGKSQEAYRLYEDAAGMPRESFRDRYLNPADVQKQLGILSQKMGNRSAAIRHFEQYLSLNPGDPERAAIEQNLRALKASLRQHASVP